jgi:hypothetical protein
VENGLNLKDKAHRDSLSPRGGGVAYKYLNAVCIKISANGADKREARSL